MISVGGLSCHLEAENRYGGRACVREVIYGVRRDCNTSRYRADKKLHQAQKDVERNADAAAEYSVFCANLWITRIIMILNKSFKYQFCHLITLFIYHMHVKLIVWNMYSVFVKSLFDLFLHAEKSRPVIFAFTPDEAGNVNSA